MSSNNSSRSRWRCCGLAAGLIFPLAVTACGTQASDQEGSSTPAPGDPRPQAVAPSAAQLKAVAHAPRTVRALVRASAGAYEVEVQSPTGFSPRAFEPVLRIGGREFTGARESATVGEYGAVFRIEGRDFDALVDASDVSVGYGRTFARPMSLGRLDKKSLVAK